MDEIDQILEQRGKAYGDYRDLARTSQRLKNTLFHAPHWQSLPPVAREGLEMICLKMARIVHSGTIHEDSFKDLAGYVRLMTKYMNEESNDAEI